MQSSYLKEDCKKNPVTVKQLLDFFFMCIHLLYPLTAMDMCID